MKPSSRRLPPSVVQVESKGETQPRDRSPSWLGRCRGGRQEGCGKCRDAEAGR